MICETMEYVVIAALVTVNVVLLVTPASGNIKCVVACGHTRDNIVCDQSLIQITDVTNMAMETNSATLEKIKRDCMGRNSCNTSRSCSTETETLLVHYLCVNDSKILSRECNLPKVKLNGNVGYILSPGYPARMPVNTDTCIWYIEVPSGSAVILALNDIVLDNTATCDRALEVAGLSCNRQNQRDNICNKDIVTSMAHCERVDIKLKPSLTHRFWMSLYVYPKDQIPRSQNNIFRCSQEVSRKKLYKNLATDPPSSSSGINNQDSNTEDPTTSTGINNQDSNTEVLVIMLSIISGISAVLLIILIIVCVRCRLLQASHRDSTCSDLSPSGPAQYMYVSSSEPEKPRPTLADGYFEVNDALQFTQRIDPQSHPYAEVEQYSNSGDGIQSSSSGEILKGLNILNKNNHYESVSDNRDTKKTEKSKVNADTSNSKTKVSRILQNENIKRVFTDNKPNLKPMGSSGLVPVDYNTSLLSSQLEGLHSQTNSDDEGCPKYETIDDHLPETMCSKSDLSPQLPPDQSYTKRKSTELLPNLSDKLHSEKRGTEVKNVNTNSSLNFFDKNSPAISKDSKETFFQTLQPNKSYKDTPRASGIVKNGIKKFELNSV